MRDIRVLFVGNSHTFFHDMPQTFKEIYEKTTGAGAEVTMLTFGGRRLEFYVKDKESLRFALLYGNYDYCVIQQFAHPYPPEEETLRDGKTIMDWCRAVGTTPVIYVTWAEKAEPENQEKMIRTCQKLQETGPSLLSPVGRIWEAMRRDYPETELYHTDGKHASPRGELLSAAVHCAAILRSPQLALPDHMLDYGDVFRSTGKMDGFLSREARRVPADPVFAEALLREIREHWDWFTEK